MNYSIQSQPLNMVPSKYYSINEICRALNICRSTFYKDQALDPDFPKRYVIGRRSPRYLWSDFLEYLEQKRQDHVPAAMGGAND